MSVIDEAISSLDRVSYGLYEKHLEFCVNSGGLVYLGRDCVFLGAAWDPVGDDDRRTLAVMYVHGKGSALSMIARMARRQGFTHAAWNRAIKRGDGRVRKARLERFERLCAAMC